jgi:phage-related protein
MMDAMKSTKDRLATTEEFIIEITRYGGETVRASYKEAFELALTKVNGATQNILKEALEATKTVSRTKHSFKIRPSVDESSFFDKIVSSIKNVVKSFVNVFKKNEDKIDDANAELKKLAKEKKSR